MLKDIEAKYKTFCDYIFNLTHVQSHILDLNSLTFKECVNTAYCSTCVHAHDALMFHKKESEQAYCWYGKYIYSCPAGFIFSAISERGQQNGLKSVVILGPITLIKAKEGKEEYQIVNKGNIPTMTLMQIGSLCEIMKSIAVSISELDHDTNSFTFERIRMLFNLYESMQTQPSTDLKRYPFRDEYKLEQSILNRDRETTEVVINRLFLYIWTQCDDFRIQKSYILQLAVVISRAVIKVGYKDTQAINKMNAFLKESEAIFDINELQTWTSDFLKELLAGVFDVSMNNRSLKIVEVIAFIDHNYAEKIPIEKLSTLLGMSRSHMSMLFKKETGFSIIEYINVVRIKQSKKMLSNRSDSIVDIAFSCGFEDQSYFGRVFKASTGYTPKKFRDIYTETNHIDK